MSLQTRIWLSAAALVLLSVAGEFVGSARRRILRREVPEGPMPALLPGQVLLRVTAADGRPVPQAAVTQILYHGTAGARGGVRQFSGLASGVTVLAAPEGEDRIRWVEVWGPSDNADDPLPFGGVLVGPVPEGATTLDVVLPHERTISGSIREDGLPKPGVKVRARRAYPEEFDFLTGMGIDSWYSESTTGPDGRFELGRLGEGGQEVAFETRPGRAIAGRRIESGSTVDIDLSAGMAPTVTVVDGSGNPLGNAPVSVAAMGEGGREGPESGTVAPDRTLAKGLTDWYGKIRIHGFDPDGKYRLVVTRPGSSEGSPGSETDWTLSDVTITLAALRVVRVRVMNNRGNTVAGRGNPHAGVVVTATPVGTGKRGVSGTTGPDGRCALGGLDSGPVIITVVDSCSFRAAETIQKREVGNSEQEELFILDRGPVISVRLAGGPAPRPVVACIREEGGKRAVGGVFRFERVFWHSVDPACAYAVVMVDRTGNLAARVENLRVAEPERTVTLSPAMELGVSVQWPAGSTERLVNAAWGDQAVGYGEERPDGTWVIRCLPAGKYLVIARCTVPGRKGKVLNFVEAEAGGEASIQVR